MVLPRYINTMAFGVLCLVCAAYYDIAIVMKKKKEQKRKRGISCAWGIWSFLCMEKKRGGVKEVWGVGWGLR